MWNIHNACITSSLLSPSATAASFLLTRWPSSPLLPPFLSLASSPFSLRTRFLISPILNWYARYNSLFHILNGFFENVNCSQDFNHQYWLRSSILLCFWNVFPWGWEAIDPCLWRRKRRTHLTFCLPNLFRCTASFQSSSIEVPCFSILPALIQ